MIRNSEYLYKNRQRFFALCGIIGPILFTPLIIIEGLIRPGYSQILNDISDLGLGPYAIIQNINFIIFGLLSIGLAMGIGANLPYRAGKATKWLVIIFGLGTTLAGVTLIFSAPGIIHASDVVPHIIVSIISFNHNRCSISDVAIVKKKYRCPMETLSDILADKWIIIDNHIFTVHFTYNVLLFI